MVLLINFISNFEKINIELINLTMIIIIYPPFIYNNKDYLKYQFIYTLDNSRMYTIKVNYIGIEIQSFWERFA
ncbi:hypothetical protein WR164_03430 [Philodulcilactobacillus myokoensis]|uniref:Uncharacterized protein n=1 Tax=Philodulcilactobacillus myokoensis TaxID=2929573 RepID=A0A9W6B1F7_9LACO|nr:hypothetical protein WR164_03430 [Philodulcilactobacillus myokoensis]